MSQSYIFTYHLLSPEHQYRVLHIICKLSPTVESVEAIFDALKVPRDYLRKDILIKYFAGGKKR